MAWDLYFFAQDLIFCTLPLSLWPHLAVTPAEQEATLSLKWINALMEVAGHGEGVCEACD